MVFDKLLHNPIQKSAGIWNQNKQKGSERRGTWYISLLPQGYVDCFLNQNFIKHCSKAGMAHISFHTTIWNFFSFSLLGKLFHKCVGTPRNRATRSVSCFHFQPQSEPRLHRAQPLPYHLFWHQVMWMITARIMQHWMLPNYVPKKGLLW